MRIPKSVVCLSVVSVASLIGACGDAETPAPLPSVAMAKAYDIPQCLKPSGLAATAQELADTKVEVRAKSCGIDPTIAVGASCDAPFTGYLIVDVPQDKRELLESIGYQQLSAFAPLRSSAC